MKIMIALLSGLLMAGSPGDGARKVDPPKAPEPRYAQTYGEALTRRVIENCVRGYLPQGFTPESVVTFCGCQTFILQDVIPLDELKKLSREEQRQLGQEIAQQCIDVGAGPRLPPPDPPKPKPEEKDDGRFI